MPFLTEKEMIDKYTSCANAEETRQGYYNELAVRTKIDTEFTHQEAGLFGCCASEDLGEIADFYWLESVLLCNIANSYELLAEMYKYCPAGENEGKDIFYEWLEQKGIDPYNSAVTVLLNNKDGNIEPKNFDILAQKPEYDNTHLEFLKDIIKNYNFDNAESKSENETKNNKNTENNGEKHEVSDSDNV